MNFDLKSLVIGASIGILLTSPFSLADLNPTSEQLEHVFTNPSKLYLNDIEIPLTHSIIEVLDIDDKTSTLFIPMNDVLGYMNYNTVIDTSTNTIHVTMKNQIPMSTLSDATPVDNTVMISNLSSTGKQLDQEVIQLIQNTGNWSYIEPYLNQISDHTLKSVIEIYNAKHDNPTEHKHLSDYIKDEAHNFKVNLQFEAVVKDDNKVGDEWHYYLECNGQTFYPQNQNAEIELKGSDLVLDLVVYEYDEGKSDYAKKSLTVPYDLLEQRDTLKFTFDMDVTENGGRYSGNTANVEYSLSIIPYFD